MPDRMNTVRIHSWSELQEHLFEDAWDASLGRYRSPRAFRGLSDASYTLDTALARLGGDYPQLEHHLLRNFAKYALRNVVQHDSVWHWLAVAQHYGLPTRLLDWTLSPLVAAHFATANVDRFALDGVIWTVDYVRTHELLPDSLRTALRFEGANLFTVDLLSHAVESLDALESLADESFPLFFEPPSMDDRIVNQYAVFSVLSDPSVCLEDWIADHPELWRRIVIPAEVKWEIRDKLDQSNITERVLFPGLDGLSRWLKRHYSPREARVVRPDAPDEEPPTRAPLRDGAGPGGDLSS